MTHNISDVLVIFEPSDEQVHMKHNELVGFLRENKQYSDEDIIGMDYNCGRLELTIYDEKKGEPKDVYEEAEMCGARPY